ncbi:hypothetical protein [Parvularcula maris]|uniref:Uncharacterized protein n=1 Tax=Parvularcula maris TaxID=2965077 RepID=A0A9X2L9Z6_9PROT|nr:hypothetical protein [Parvularcula maris]MCQ8185860.1 hypothetical protein [Parvularcula maris]
MMKFLTSVVISVALAWLCSDDAKAQPFPPGFDVRNNAVRGADFGEASEVRIVPYNAGETLFENERFAVRERINFLSTDLQTHGDAICTITKPGERYEYQASRLVVIVKAERDEPITREFLWNEVRPVLRRLVHEEGHCPMAHGITAHIYLEGWDVSANGVPYIPEAF